MPFWRSRGGKLLGGQAPPNNFVRANLHPALFGLNIGQKPANCLMFALPTFTHSR
jgi:hypothetical protein